MQVLSLLVLLLIFFRTFLPPFIHPANFGFEPPEADFIAFRDSVRRLEARYAGFSQADLLSSSGRSDIPEPAELFPRSELFPFDPNTAELEDLLNLRVPERTARILVNYREAGGRFYVDSDLMKIYGMDPELFSLLEPYIRIPDRVADPDAMSSPDAEHLNRLLFELNSADSIQLLSVYGIGPVFAHRIIRYRDLLGGFYNSEQLMEVYGFNEEQQQELIRRSYIDTNMIRKMDMNSTRADGFRRHPYLGPYQSQAMVEYRKLIGDYDREIQVLENGLLTDSVYRKVRPYLEVKN
jgi:DNA uptake protein ComE-like DNA-binding protein